MMRCAKTKKILSDYLDDNLSNRRRRQLEAHLRDCSDCEAELAQLRSLSAMLQKAGKVEVPEEYWDNYWHRLSVKLPPIKARANWRQRLFRPFRKPIPAVYVLLAALFVGLAVFFSDFYLDSRKTESPKVAIAPGDSYYSAGHASRATTPAKPEPLKEELVEDRKNAAVTEGASRFGREVDGIKDKEMGAKRGEIFGELKESRETTSKGTNHISPDGKTKIRDLAKEDALHRQAETKASSVVVQTEMSVREKLAMDETAEMRARARTESETLYEAPEPESADELATLDTRQERSAGAKENAVLFRYGRESARDVKRRRLSKEASSVSLAPSAKHAEPYGLIIRVLKINPANAKLNTDISRGTAPDNVFLSDLRKANRKVNFEFALSSKNVTLVGGETSLAFRSGTRDYTFQLKILPPSDNQREYKLASSTNYSTPKPGETVMFNIPKAKLDENNFIVLVTRFKP